MSEPNHDNNIETKYQQYLDERKLLIDAEAEGARSFDKAIMTLSAGALGLSLTFIKEIVCHPHGSTLWLLIGAWVGFCLSGI